MNAKKIFAATLLILLFSSAANAKLTEQETLNDDRIGPFVEITKQQGEKFLPGRYAQTIGILSRVHPEDKMIIAASSLVIEIGKFDKKNKFFPAKLDFYGKKLIKGYAKLDTSGAVPILRIYDASSSKKHKLIAEDFAVLQTEGDKYFWFLGSTENGDIHSIFPLNVEYWFPKNWYLGKWIAADNSEIELDADGIVSIHGNVFGTYTISDNRILVKTPDNKEDAAYCVYNSDEDYLVITFTSGPNGMGENAAVFTREKD